MSRSAPSPALLAAGVVAAATLLGLMEAGQTQYDRVVHGDPISWPHALVHGLPRWYAWALLLPLVLAVTRWISRASLGPVPAVLLHLLAGVGVILLQVTLVALASNVLHGNPDPLGLLRPALIKYMGLTFLSGFVTYGAMVGGWYAVEYRHRWREREAEASRLALQTSELERRLTEAQLRRLQSQLEPHFLFNALHSLSSLMLQGDTRRAVRATARLSDLLRRALRSSERTEHTVAEELALVEDYLAIQQVRFDDRLSVRVEVDPDAVEARIPALVLQPLVENAVVHGIERDPEAREVRIDVRREGDAVSLRIRNEGPGLERGLGGDGGAGSGVGLANVRARLATLHGDAAVLVLREVEGGVEAEVRVPFRSVPAPAVAGAS